MKYFNQKQLLLGTLLLVLAIIPATVFLAQQKQEQRSHASVSTKLYLTPSTTATSPLQKKVGDTVSFDVYIDPGTNLPSLIKLDLQYNQTKLQPSQTPFVVNTTAFPNTIEGPVVQNGELLINLSIGSDPTKVIKSVTKVGTVTFSAAAPTDSNSTSITFGPSSQVFSLAKTDQANENVLSTTEPGYVAILASAVPTITSVPPPQRITPTPLPGASPTPNPSPTLNPTATYLSFTAFLHGIGNSGDNANPTVSSLSNKTPVRQTRNVTVYVYSDQNQLVSTKTGTITYDGANGNYTGSVDFGNTVPDGYYTVYIKEDTHLRRVIPGIQHIVPQKNNIMPTVSLVAGDVNGDNTINILDYNILIGCYSDLLPAVSCPDNNKVLSDLNDDGAVNQIDYNLFLREITVQNGN